MYTICLVEDEINLANLVVKYLINEGYNVIWYKTGEEAMANIDDNIDLWILDIMLPGIVNGYDLLKEIRHNNTLKPVIFTSARDKDIDKVMGLELGSDDYLAKPYSIRELVLRVKNLLSRTYKNSQNVNTNNELYICSYRIDKEKRSVFDDGVAIQLTSKEYDLLSYLIENPGKAFAREQILDVVWGANYFGSDRVVDDLLRRLRQKMPKLNIETIYGYGYRLISWKRYQYEVR